MINANIFSSVGLFISFFFALKARLQTGPT